MIIIFITGLFCVPKYKVSADRKTLTISGLNEIVDKESYSKSGTYQEYTHIEIEYGIIGLNDHAFSLSGEMISIKLPTSLKSIGMNCFSSCTKLISIIIPEGIDELKTELFKFCYNLKTIDIPSSLKRICSPIFRDCNSLNKFICHDGGWFSTLSDGTFLVLNNTIGIACTSKSNVQIPPEVVSLNDYFMNGLSRVNSITFCGNNLKYICKGAFDSAISLTSLSLPSGVLSIGASFIASSGVSSLMLPNTLIDLPSNAFDGAANLARVDIDGDCKAVHKDSQGVIYDENNTTVMFIPPSIQAFNISKSVRSLNIEALKNNENLVKLFVDDDNQNFSSDGCALYNKDKTILICGIGGIKSIKVCPECQKINNSAYSGMSVETLEFLGKNVTHILEKAFQSSCVHTVNFSEGITHLNWGAFHSAKLTSIKLPSTIISISDQCFLSTPVETVDMSACNKLTYVGSNIFTWCQSLREIKLPSNMPYIGSSQFSSCESLRRVSIPPLVSKIKNGAFSSSGLESITFEGNNVQYIGEKAFEETKLIQIEIPNSVTEIQNMALSNCKLLTSVIINKESSLQIIRSDLIKGSNNLTNIWFPKSVTNISESALGQSMKLINITFDKENKYFIGRNGIVIDLIKKEIIACGGGRSSVQIDNDVISIGPSAFLNCINLITVIFSPDSKMQYIGKSTFLGCSSISSLSLPRFMEAIESNAFSNCLKLKSVDFGYTQLPKFLYSIGENAFSGCKELEKIELPFSLNSIGKSAFINCKTLTQIVLGRNITIINENAFAGCQKLLTIAYCINPSESLVGISDLAFSGLPSQTVIYVSNSYKNITLGGRIVLKLLDKDCAMPTIRFTQKDSFEPSIVISVISIIIHE